MTLDGFGSILDRFVSDVMSSSKAKTGRKFFGCEKQISFGKLRTGSSSRMRLLSSGRKAGAGLALTGDSLQVVFMGTR